MTRSALKEIENRLLQNGWILSSPEKESKLAEFVKAYDNGKNVLGIEVTLKPESLGCYGHYGVCCVKLVKFEAEMPYYKDDFVRMDQLIVEVERDLLKAEVPFRPSYGFGGMHAIALESCLGKNYDLRRRYHLDEFEHEDFYKTGTEVDE